MSQHRYMIGLEGGGSTTHVVIFDKKEKKIIADIMEDVCCNRYLVGLETALQYMRDTVIKTCQANNVALSDVSAVGLTVSGFNGGDQNIDDYYKKQAGFPKTVALHDTDGPLYALLGKFDAVGVVIAGTGSAGKIVKKGGYERMIAAMGHLLGETACGHDTAQRFIIELIRLKDGYDDRFITQYATELGKLGYNNLKPDVDSLWKQAAIHFGIEGKDIRGNEFLDIVYAAGSKPKIASLCKKMNELVADPLVMAIFLKEIDELVELITVLKKNCDDTLPILMVGSFWKVLANPKIKGFLKERLNGIKVELLEPRGVTACYGAAKFADGDMSLDFGSMADLFKF